MITDLHCHFPMHLVHGELEPHGHDLWRRAVGAVEQEVFDLAARAINNPRWDGGFRVDLDGLREGGVGLVCSVLYWPPGELLPGTGAHPRPGTFDDLMRQIDDVEAHLTNQVIVRTASDLDNRDGLRFVHCVEGGFHLGTDAASVREHVGLLASRGVFYITLAHLIYRGVAANAPAIPPLTDSEYADIFHQDADIGLTDLGRAAVEAMVEHGVVVDISHMRQDAIDATFALLDKCDPAGGLPVIASHVGVRSEEPNGQAYNISPATMRAVAERGGVIGLILAEHQLGESTSMEQSREIIGRHARAIFDVLKTHEHTAIGTDLDGFIKPTLHGLQNASDLATLEHWIKEDFGEAADAILHANADRVIAQAFAVR